MTRAIGERARATAIGAVAILLWALLALMTVGAAGIPPFQLLALTFLIAAALGLLVGRLRHRPLWPAVRRAPGAVGLTVAGLFGYHAFYFAGMAAAPPAHVSLIAYLWPVLIVVFASLLPGERLRWPHLGGVLTGLVGASVLTLDSGGPGLDLSFAWGYAAAAACALTWSSYSVLNRRLFRDTPTEIVTFACAIVAALGFLCHLLLEETVTPDGARWIAILGLGIGPVGAAFFLWDYGTKRGDIQLLGILSYAAPPLSVLALVLAGRAAPSWTLLVACLLIAGGALLASLAPARPKPA